MLSKKNEIRIKYPLKKSRKSSRNTRKKRDAIHEFEIELTDNQIEKLVDDGIYIKVSFGIKQSGLIFIPNYQLNTLEEENQTKYKIFIRETTSYFVYNKEHSDKNQYIKGRTLIRQLTNDSRVIPYRRATVKEATGKRLLRLTSSLN